MEASESLEKDTAERARALYKKAAEHKPSLFEPADWMGRMIDWSLKDESLREALFRFVDVLPSLDSAADIGRHLREYFGRVDHALGGLVFLAQALRAGWLVAPVLRQNVVRLARRFIVEEEAGALLPVLEALRAEPAGFTLDVVGEETVSEAEADQMKERYLNLMRLLSPASEKWPAVPQIDNGPQGLLPRVNLSVKLSALCARFDPLDPETPVHVKNRLRAIFREASRLGAALTVDMERHDYKELTLGIFRGILEEEEFRERPQAAIALQAYLLGGERDLRELVEWAAARKRRIGVRLVKGAYWDSEVAWARQKNWPIPVFMEKAATDAAFERMSRILLESSAFVDTAFGSHNLRSVAHGMVVAERLGIPKNGLELQVLFGMGEPVRQALVQSGYRVRVYLPVGALIPGMAYLIRRLMENTSNTSFLRQTFAEEIDLETLIKAPVPQKHLPQAPSAVLEVADAEAPGLFTNAPPLDFSSARAQQEFAQALDDVKGKLGRYHPLWIGGKEERAEGEFTSVNPASPDVIVGRVPLADNDLADRAVEIARDFFPQWRRTPAKERAAVLFRAAAVMRRRRLELAALEVVEVAKGWREADADVIEAIDYLEFYGREMIRLGEPRLTQRVPGESNILGYQPKGVAAIIAPWNFPLAILTGMSTAALVAGNCVLIKPAEQSPVTGAALMQILREAGAPQGACQLLQGSGELGAHLVSHRDVNLIAFTGSAEVGLQILRQAPRLQPGQNEIKRVVCEMGGKNGIIVDEDADLDEAVVSILESAFGYQGQKCSAASRLILLEEIHDRLVHRLVEAVKSLKIGAPENPRHFIGPLIDEAAESRVRGYIELGKKEGRCVVEMEAPLQGYYVGPAIFTEIEPSHRLAREEIFGPVLSVLKARDFEHAMEMANDCPFALTGGLFSRSPAHIEEARREFRVGNLYINRGITGAIVQRQPFGGVKLSGVGSKAGGPEYLLQFLEPKTVSEKTLRHGFVPSEDVNP